MKLTRGSEPTEIWREAYRLYANRFGAAFALLAMLVTSFCQRVPSCRDGIRRAKLDHWMVHKMKKIKQPEFRLVLGCIEAKSCK